MIVYFDRLGRILNNGAVLEISEMSRVIKLEILQLFASPLEQNWSKVDDINLPLAGRDSAIFSKFYSKNTQRQLTMCIQLFTKYNYSTKSITNFDWLVCIHFSCTAGFPCLRLLLNAIEWRRPLQIGQFSAMRSIQMTNIFTLRHYIVLGYSLRVPSGTS